MRQIKIIEEGGIIEQNTLLFNPQLGKTKPMRSKEEAHDYRYFPDPDLLPLKLEDDFIEIIKKDIPELPDERKKRYTDETKMNLFKLIFQSLRIISIFKKKVYII